MEVVLLISVATILNTFFFFCFFQQLIRAKNAKLEGIKCMAIEMPVAPQKFTLEALMDMGFDYLCQ